MSSGGSFHSSSGAPRSIERPQRFDSALYGLSAVKVGTWCCLAYSIASVRVMPRSRVGVMTFSLGASARISTSSATPPPAAAVRDRLRVLDAGDVDELLGDQRPRERRAHRRPIVVERVGLQRRQDEIGGQIPRADRARAPGRRRPRARGRGSLRARAPARDPCVTATISRLVVLLQPGNGDRGVEAARVREDDAFHVRGRRIRRGASRTWRRGGRPWR